MEAEVGTPINYNPDDFMSKEEDHQPDEQKPEPENNEQYYFPPPQQYYEPYPQPCLLYTSPSPRDTIRSRMPSSA